jgi:hypothetical protein
MPNVLAKVLHISVLPTPVGPSMSTFDLSICNGSGVGSSKGSASGGADECGEKERSWDDDGSAEL